MTSDDKIIKEHAGWEDELEDDFECSIGWAKELMQKARADEREKIINYLKGLDFYRLLDKGKVWGLSNDILCDELGDAIIKKIEALAKEAKS